MSGEVAWAGLAGRVAAVAVAVAAAVVLLGAWAVTKEALERRGGGEVESAAKAASCSPPDRQAREEGISVDELARDGVCLDGRRRRGGAAGCGPGTGGLQALEEAHLGGQRCRLEMVGELLAPEPLVVETP